MHPIHSKTIFISLLAASMYILQSCSEDAPEPVPSGTGHEMKFASVGLSRAVTSGISYAGSKFAVFGDMRYSDGNLIEIFNNTEVEYDGTHWSYSGIKYWYPEHEHSFIGVYPPSVVDEGNSPVYSDSKLSFSYTVPASGNQVDKNDVTDILGATHRRLYKLDDALPISFNFDHLMTLVDITPAFTNSFMSPDDYLRFKKVVITGLKNTADFSIVPSPRLSGTTTEGKQVQVSNQGGDTQMTIEFPDAKKIMNLAGHTSIFDVNDALIMLPQTFAADSQSKIIMTYTHNDEPEDYVISFPLKLQNWESGKSCTYKFTLDGIRMVIGTTSITDWNTVSDDLVASSQ